MSLLMKNKMWSITLESNSMIQIQSKSLMKQSNQENLCLVLHGTQFYPMMSTRKLSNTQELLFKKERSLSKTTMTHRQMLMVKWPKNLRESSANNQTWLCFFLTSVVFQIQLWRKFQTSKQGGKSNSINSWTTTRSMNSKEMSILFITKTQRKLMLLLLKMFRSKTSNILMTCKSIKSKMMSLKESNLWEDKALELVSTDSIKQNLLIFKIL